MQLLFNAPLDDFLLGRPTRIFSFRSKELQVKVVGLTLGKFEVDALSPF